MSELIGLSIDKVSVTINLYWMLLATLGWPLVILNTWLVIRGIKYRKPHYMTPQSR